MSRGAVGRGLNVEGCGSMGRKGPGGYESNR